MDERVQQQEESVERTLTEFIAHSRDAPLSASVRHAVRRHVLDAMGVMAAASATDFGRRLRNARAPLGKGATALGSRDRHAADEAALVNGVLAHGLDFDDTHQPSIMHVGCVIVPTALAVGEVLEASDEVIERAVAVGYEMATRMGAAAAGAFHMKGFHATSVLGALSASLLAGMLKGFTPEALAQSLGIAGSFGSGLEQFLEDGADTKRLHAGWAAHAGIRAAEFAEAGFGGPRGILGGRFGVYATHVGLEHYRPAVLTNELGTSWSVCQTSIKPYPCCHLMHAHIDAAKAIRQQHHFTDSDIYRVRVGVHEAGLKLLTEPRAEKLRPSTPYSAKFSLPFAVAAALAGDDIQIETFAATRLDKGDLTDLIDVIEFFVDPETKYPDEFDGVVEIHLRDGSVLKHREHSNRGSPRRPLADEEVNEKFVENIVYAGGAANDAEGLGRDFLHQEVGFSDAVQAVNRLILGSS